MAGVRVRFTINDAGLRAFEETRVRRYMLGLGGRVLNNARGRVNVDTDLLRQSGAVTSRGDVVRVGFYTHYARFVHDGWRHHTDSGHYRGNPYLRRAMRDEVRK